MLDMEVVAIISEIHTEHTNAVYGQNVVPKRRSETTLRRVINDKME
jgi:hypothetical protein